MSARGSGKLSDHMTRVYLGACLRRNLDLHLPAATSRPAQGMLAQAVLRRGCPAHVARLPIHTCFLHHARKPSSLR